MHKDLHIKSLAAIEKAIALLDISRTAVQINQDEVVDALKELRAVRTEIQTEVGDAKI